MKSDRQQRRRATVGDTETKSTLEARWALFFCRFGVSWFYEPKTFDLGNGNRYTPDFKVIGLGWIEVKPTREHLRTESWHKVRRWMQLNPKETLLAFCDARLPLGLRDVLLFRDGKVSQLDERGAGQFIITRHPRMNQDNQELGWTALNVALQAASSERIDHMVRAGAHLSDVIEDIIRNFNRSNAA